MDDLTMFVKYSVDSGPEEYAFGPDWVGMALFMDDMGSDTEEEAVLEWYFKIFKKRKETRGYVPTKCDVEVEEWMTLNRGSERDAILRWYHEEYKKRWAKDASRNYE